MSGSWSTNWGDGKLIVWGSTNFILAVVFLLMAVVCWFQILRFLWNRHRKFSYQMGFLLFVFVWTSCRFLFFLLVEDWSALTAVVLQWIPILIQFSTFSLLVVYYIQQLHRDAWPRVMKITVFIYVTVNLLFLTSLLTYWILVFQYNNIGEEQPKWLGTCALVLSGTVFLVLVLVLGYYAFQVFRQVQKGEIAVRLAAPFPWRHVPHIRVGLGPLPT